MHMKMLKALNLLHQKKNNKGFKGPQSGSFFTPSTYTLIGDNMDKEGNITNYNHSINILERKNILITGVKKIESFDDTEFLLETVMGYLALKGENLELLKLDTMQGNVSIKGLLKSFTYLDENMKKEKDGSIISKLFK